MNPSFYICGGGSHINCKYWDDVNGCWRDEEDAMCCPVYISIDRRREIDDKDVMKND